MKSCANCREMLQGIGCEIYPCAWTWFSLKEDEFCCNQWKENKNG